MKECVKFSRGQEITHIDRGECRFIGYFHKDNKAWVVFKEDYGRGADVVSQLVNISNIR